MAKKVVASLKKSGGVSYTKAFKLVKTSKGAYGYESKVLMKELVDDFHRTMTLKNWSLCGMKSSTL